MPSFPPYGAIFYELQEQSQLLNRYEFFNMDPTKNVYLVIIYKKTWYFSESKTIDVHCRGAKVLRHVILGSMREKCKIL
jgi:hypothetical protein